MNRSQKHGNAPVDWCAMEGYSSLPQRPRGPATLWFVYKIQNVRTGQSYVGVSSSPRHRLSTHIRDKYPIGCALRKYGPATFAIKLLFSGPEEECYQAEPLFIGSHRTLNITGGYNIDLGGSRPPTMHGEDHPMFGKAMPAEIRARLSRANTGKHHSAETIAKKKLWRPTEETRSKLRLARARQVCTVETRIKRGIACQGKSSMLSAENVRHIRSSELPRKDLARLYAVSLKTVFNIKRRVTWKWLE